MPAGDAKPAQRAFDRLVDHGLQLSAASLDLADEVAGHVERLAHVVEQRLAAVVNRVRARIHQSRWSTFLSGEHDLREDDLRQVLAGVAVDDLDLAAVAHQLGDAFERDVTTRLRVVELAIRILLDKVSLSGRRHLSTVISSQY